MSESPVISAAPLEHPALDYAFLRQEGIRHLERMAGHLWTDFNAHDPGITILEQLCYAITDLSYRASHDVPDLLASSGEDLYESLFSPATILTSHPVTPLDLRKLVLDVDGVKNAWIEEVEAPTPTLYYHEGRKELLFDPEPPFTAPVRLKGLYRVLIETSSLDGPDGIKVQREVARRLHASRPLCADFDEIRVLGVQRIKVDAEVEIGQVDDVEGVLLDIYEALAEHISPSVPFATLGEMLAAGKRSDEIFDGPPLEHGFIDSEALARMVRRRSLYTSDLIHALMDVPGVRAVRKITLSANGKTDAWSIPLDATEAPRLDVDASSIILVKGRLTARPDRERIVQAYNQRRQGATSYPTLAVADRDFIPPRGRDRKIGEYTSIQHQFPALYGIGSMGLPDSATPERKAQAKQLKAYLMFFDQLLASYFAQLAHAGSLFSFSRDEMRTYFAQTLDDPTLGLEGVLARDADGHRAHVEEIAERTVEPLALSKRKQRFLNHLMARFAEQFTDYSLVLLGGGAGGERAAEDRLVRDKAMFLRRYPRLSSARGTGWNLLEPWSADNVSGLEERIRRKLGLAEEQGERFLLVEHVLLRPVEEDKIALGEREYKQIPLLAASVYRDPYSLQLSFVFPSSAGRLQQREGEVNEFRRLVEQTIREETPAHLTPYIHWMNEDEWQRFELAYSGWLHAYRSYRAAKFGV